MKQVNVFLFIIWNNAYPQKERILNDIQKEFRIIKVQEIQWSKQKFNENLNRFYGQKLPPNSFKEKACGYGPFTLVVYEDESPNYENRRTTRGIPERVNIHSFDKKMLYREWTRLPSGNNCVHGTNTSEETEHDLTLLTGLCPNDYINRASELPDYTERDLAGSNGWSSLEELFYILNYTCKYCILRNFESIPKSFVIDGHNDIDLLVENYEEARRICNSTQVFKYKYRVHNKCNVKGETVLFDFRYVGDGYYDTKWEKDILENRISYNGVFIPDQSNYQYMILYHALVQKWVIADNYTALLNDLFGEKKWDKFVLTAFLSEKGYSYSEPYDISVVYNSETTGRKASLFRRIRVLFRLVRRKMFNDQG